MIKTILAILFAVMICICNSGYWQMQNKKNVGYYCDTTYSDTDTSTLVSHYVTINFDSYTMEQNYVTRGCPIYRNLTQENSCAPLAGSILVSYYDYNCPNLLANYESCYIYNGNYYFKPQNAQVIDMKEYLYELMGTNTIQPGTSVNQFKTGLTAYANEKGYNTTYTDCGNVDINDIKAAFNQQKPVVLFMSGYDYYNIGGISIGDNSMTLHGHRSTSGHVVIAFAYRKYTYYQNNSVSRIDEYLYCAFGDGTEGLIALNSDTHIDNSYAVTIY